MTNTLQITFNSDRSPEHRDYYLKFSFLFALCVLFSTVSYGQTNETLITNNPKFDKGAAFAIFNGNTEPIIVSGLSTFECKKTDGEIELKWITRTAMDHAGFEVERSTDNQRWKNLAYVEAYDDHPSPGEYHFRDLRPKKGNNFYRLRQIDMEGRVNYSNVIRVEMMENDYPESFKIYPNPVSGETVYLKLPVLVEEGTYLELFDPAGRRMLRQKVIAPFAELDVTALNTGVYLIKIQIGRTVWSQKLVIQ